MKPSLRYASKAFFILIFISFHWGAQCQGFPTSATNWDLPPGGQKYNDIDYSFRYISYSAANSTDDIGSQSWVSMDMNGDAKPDMVVYKEKQANGENMVFSPTSNPYWKVYLGNDSGFSQTSINWALPPGGQKYNGIDYSYRYISYSAANSTDDTGSQSWVMMDMNGDSKPDMVVYKEKRADGNNLVYGTTSNPYWKVYINTGNGFSQTAINWALPPGGQKYNSIDYSFRYISYSAVNSADDTGSQSWEMMDMNGDSKPDMVVYKEKQTNGNSVVYSTASNPYWKVYFNTGAGFSQTAVNWALPSGGQKYNGIDYSFRYISYSAANSTDDTGSQSWVLMDMNGDAKPDIVVYKEKQANGENLVYSLVSNPCWKVYLNTGNGFSQITTNWVLPPGGQKYNGTDYSFRYISYSAANSTDDTGSQSWEMIDMNGDGKPDMVVYKEKQTNGNNLVYGPALNPYWKVFLNSGAGFSQTTVNWTLPSGGQKYNGTDYSFRYISYSSNSTDDIGSQSWVVMDMNGDGKPDMVVYKEKQANGTQMVYNQASGPYWRVYLNNSTALGTEVITSNSAIIGYPNPVTDNLQLQIGDSIVGQSYTIYDIWGKSIKKGDLTELTNTINLSAIPIGIYILKLDDINKAIKIIKQ